LSSLFCKMLLILLICSSSSFICSRNHHIQTSTLISIHSGTTFTQTIIIYKKNKNYCIASSVALRVSSSSGCIPISSWCNMFSLCTMLASIWFCCSSLWQYWKSSPVTHKKYGIASSRVVGVSVCGILCQSAIIEHKGIKGWFVMYIIHVV
jgi:hypothetical protein